MGERPPPRKTDVPHYGPTPQEQPAPAPASIYMFSARNATSSRYDLGLVVNGFLSTPTTHVEKHELHELAMGIKGIAVEYYNIIHFPVSDFVSRAFGAVSDLVSAQ